MKSGEGDTKTMKHYYEQYGIGKAKYVVNYYNGASVHEDGSPFYDIRIFKNRTTKDAFIKELEQCGYHERKEA